MNEEIPELIQLARSHFNEKARWGFDFKRVSHQRTTVLPGLQRPRVQKLTGQPQVPVARFGDRYVPGSAAILAELDRLFPDPPLLPADPELAAEALRIQDHFDENVGPLTRRGVFSFVLDDPEFFSRIFGSHLGLVRRKLFHGVAILVAPVVRKEVGLGRPGGVEQAYQGTEQALEFVAERSQATGYLVGDCFTVADLAAAALLALTVDTGHPSMRLPEPWPRPYLQWLAHWRDHPGAKWVRGIYDRHRGESSALN